MDKYIKAGDLLEAIFPESQENSGKTVTVWAYTLTRDDLEAVIDTLPAADVASVVHGQWVDDVYTDPYGAKWTKYRCSLCGRIEVVKEPYCNCGAKMDLED